MKISSFLIALVTFLVTFPTYSGQDEAHFVLDENTVYLFGEVDDYSVGKAVNKIKQLQNKLLKPKEIFLLIDSPGGYVSSGRKLIRTIRTSPIPVTCFIDGLAASMAAMIFETCHKRLVGEDSVLMFHEAAGSFRGEFNHVKSMTAFIFRYVQEMEEEVAKKLGMTMEVYRIHATNQLWLTGTRAVEMGGADSLIASIQCDSCDEGEDEEKIQQTRQENTFPVIAPAVPETDLSKVYWGLKMPSLDRQKAPIVESLQMDNNTCR